MPKTKDGFIIDDEPVTKPMTKEEALEYIERSFKKPDEKKPKKKGKDSND